MQLTMNKILRNLFLAWSQNCQHSRSRLRLNMKSTQYVCPLECFVAFIIMIYSQALVAGTQSPYTVPSTPSGAPPGSQSGLPGLQREASNQSQTPTQGYGAVIQQPAIIPQPQPGYNPQHFQVPQNNTSYVPDLPRDKPVFGVSLDHLLDRDGSAVPIIVYQCIQAVDLYGLTVEGIYRIPGTKPHIDRIKNIFDNGELYCFIIFYLFSQHSLG